MKKIFRIAQTNFPMPQSISFNVFLVLWTLKNVLFLLHLKTVYFLSRQWARHAFNTPDHQILRNLSQWSLGGFCSSSLGFQVFLLYAYFHLRWRAFWKEIIKIKIPPPPNQKFMKSQQANLLSASFQNLLCESRPVLSYWLLSPSLCTTSCTTFYRFSRSWMLQNYLVV